MKQAVAAGAPGKVGAAQVGQQRLDGSRVPGCFFQLFFAMLGANPAPEFPSARGYADAVVERPDAVYVFEFKYDETSEAAIKQIRDRGYADKWIGGKRPVTLIGINFNPKKRNIDIPAVEPA